MSHKFDENLFFYDKVISLKPANILFSKGVFKLADFGLAKYIQD
jgi:hypothetical protein